MAPVQKNVLAPGDSTVVELIFNAKTAVRPPLPVKKSANITSNDSARATLPINFSGRVVPDTDTVSTVVFGPPILNFHPDGKKGVILVENIKDSLDLVITQVGYLMDDFKIEAPKKAIAKGKKGEIKVAWIGAQPEYDVERSITFETGSKATPRFSVSYFIKGLKGPSPKAAPQHAAKTPPSSNPTGANASANKPPLKKQMVPPGAPARADTVKNETTPWGEKVWPPPK
jgi:hypothetical protein